MTDRPTDRPDRHSTMAPPPDRTRKTDPPLPTDKAPPEIVTLSENVILRLEGIESAIGGVRSELADVNLRLGKLDEIHSLLMGAAPEHPGDKPRPSIVSELHQMNNHAGVIGVNTELVAEVVGQVAEQQKTLPELIAEAVANKVVALYQSEIRALREADNALLKRIEQVAEVAGLTETNGNSHK